MSAKPVVYKVETYIVPYVNRLPSPIIAHKIDDVTVTNQLNEINYNETCKNNVQSEEETCPDNERLEVAECLAKDSKTIGVNVVENVNKSEIIRDRQFDHDKYNDEDVYHSDDHVKTQRTEFKVSIEAQDALYPVRQFKRINSLMSIDERSEGSDIKVNDFCHHGYQNGCTAMIPPPEEVSEEVFRENWLHKIEILRQQEIILRKREMHLQNREREIFRKEKELRIAQRALKEKMKQVEQQLKHQRDIETVQKRLERTARIVESKSLDEFNNKSSDDYAKVEKQKPFQHSMTQYEDKETNKKTNLMHVKSCVPSRQLGSSNISINVNSYSSMRYKERPKMSYDDMNSTLSADIGDSSFVRTSERFNPHLYKKPYAFTRSASERRPKQKSQTLEDRSKYVIEEEKIFRKLSGNICISQDKDTRFQNYGLVDCRIQEDLQNKEYNSQNEEKPSQHNPKTDDKLCHRKPVNASIKKDRPISWNDEADDWLQKKRQAYNLAIQRSIENKENLKCNSTEKDSQVSKKDIKNKIFTIFR